MDCLFKSLLEVIPFHFKYCNCSGGALHKPGANGVDSSSVVEKEQGQQGRGVEGMASVQIN